MTDFTVPDRPRRTRALRSVASVDNELREGMLRLLGAMLMLAGGLLVVGAASSSERGMPFLFLTNGFAWILAVPGLLGAALWRRPDAQALVVPIAIAAWLAALVVGAAVGFAGFDGNDLDLATIRGLTAGFSVLCTPIMVVAAVGCAIDPARRSLARWSWAAVATWSLPFAVEAYASCVGHRSAIVWLDAIELSDRTVRLFVIGCAACMAVFLGIERHPTHRRGLGLVCLVATVGVLVSHSWPVLDGWREGLVVAALYVCWAIAMAISLVPGIDLADTPSDDAHAP